MKTDDELYDGLEPEYKQMQRDLAAHKIKKARAKINRLCKADINERDVLSICNCREAIEFWESSYKW